MFAPRKFQATMVASIGGDLWRYLGGGREQADYYLKPDGTPCEAVAELHGRLWQRLGIDRLDRTAFQRLAAGLHPLTGERLVKASHAPRPDPATGRAIARGGMRVPGIDCNLSPPKSVSVLLPFATPDQRAALERAHRAAVHVTLTELERRVAACRPTVNGEQVHTPGELGIAVFTHHTSRPTPETANEPGRPPDPQLHSHAFVFNLAWCQGRYLAVDSRPVYRYASTAEAIYSCELAAQLTRLGYRLTWQQARTGRTWELRGVDRRLADLFSSRHRRLQQQAAAFQARRGRPPTLRERDRLAARDRAPKTDACTAPHWTAYRAVLARHRLQVPTPHRHQHRTPTEPLAEREAAVRARLLAPDGLTAHDATVDHAALTKATYQAATGLLDAAEARAFLDRFATEPDLVPVATPQGPRYTTAVLLAQEQRIAQVARAKARTRVVAPRPELLAAAAAFTATGPKLSKEQLAALRHLGVPVGWASLEGRAGTGKTTLLRTLLRAYRGNGQPVVLVSTAAETARRTARELDLERGYTVEAFTRAVATGHLQPTASWVVLVEEAAMVDTPRMAALLEAAGPASIRTLGDPEQAQPVGPGGWQELVDEAIGGHAELTHVVRQHDPADRAACQAIRDGRAPEALASLHARGRLHLAADRSTAVKELVHAWDRHRAVRGLDGVAIVTDTDNRTVDTLNALCQARREANGELTGPAVTVVDRAHSRCERLFAGDRVRFVHPYRANNDLFPVYVPNGTAGQVLAVDPEAGEVVVEVDDGRTVAVQPGVHEDAQPLRLGYAGHALKLQGGQAAVVLALPGGWQTSRQSAYSMATRSMEELHVFIDAQTQQAGSYRDRDPVQALGERWTRDASKHAASQPPWTRQFDGPSGQALDDDLVAAPYETREPMPVWPSELARERDLGDGLAIEF